jgi:threonine dehydratase
VSDSPDARVPTPAHIEAAAARIQDRVRRTPVLTVGGRELPGVGAGVISLKLEMLQHTGSFKPRGAFNRILACPVPEVGVIAASGGNHAQAVAWAARELGHRAEIFVPRTAPAIKVARLHELGATVVQVGALYDEAREAADSRASETGALMVHAYDQPEVVAGAGTLARELEGQLPELSTVLVAVGGGGLIGGTAAWFRGRRRVIGVEPRRCPTLHAARDAGEPVDTSPGGLASDSLAARRIGGIAFAAAQRWVADSVLVEDDDIASAMQLLWDRFRVVAEPGGATALAALLSGAYRPQPQEHVVALICGANVNPATLGRTP